MSESVPFWQTKRLSEMTKQEWESLCDGCAKCCLYKLEDNDTKKDFYTNVVCKFLDLESCRGTHYKERSKPAADCIEFDSQSASQLNWLSSTYACRLIDEGKDLPSWHPLVSCCSNSVHQTGISVRSFAQSKNDIEDLVEHIMNNYR